MLLTMKPTFLRRTAARVAVAGAIALIPLAAVTIPASADVTVDNAPADVAWPHQPSNPWWDHGRDRDRDRDDWRHDRDRDRDDWNRHRHDDNWWWRHLLPDALGSW
ncbi:hypothetical protein ACFXO9_04570 [Nocardia tengchongensis]|uniref:hypothetical protein n=1 Tax=Nocardia tengchongensis TaxID=2055889 RepID=UPI0036B930B7